MSLALAAVAASKITWICTGGCGAGLAAVFAAVRMKLHQGGIIRAKPCGPLEGIRVIDISVAIAAPWSTALMSEMGAEVIKVESLDLPDSARALGTSPAPGMAGLITQTSRGKQSIVLNLKTEAGKEVLMRMLEKCDVLIQNFRPGAADRMGISYEQVIKVNPGIIYVSSSGYGESGPNAHDRVYDPIVQCMCGVCTIQARDPKPHPGVPPKARNVAQAIFDKATAMTTCQAIIAALYARAEGLGGQHIATNMLDVATYWMWPDCCINWVWTQPTLPEAPYVIDSLPNKKEKIDSVKDVLTNPENRKFIETAEHLVFGKFKYAKFPVDFESTPVVARPPPPMLGEHSAKILKELGYTYQQRQSLLQILPKASVVSTKTLLLMAKKASKAKIFGLIECLQGGAPTFAESKVQKVYRRKSFDFVGIERRGPRVKRGVSMRSPPSEVLAEGPLATVRVLELSSMIAGPMAASMLGDQGADVVKVEQAGQPDPSRSVGPSPGKQMGAMYAAINRNKRSVSLDLKTDEGVEQVMRIAADADVIIVDNDPRSIRFYDKLPYTKIRTINRDCIYVFISKEDGELACQAKSGLCALQRSPHGNLEFVNCMIAEKTASFYAASAASAALLARRGGRGGQYIAINMRSACVHFAFCDIFWSNQWENPQATNSFVNIGEAYQLRTSSDGTTYFTMVLSDKEWNDFLKVFVDKYKLLELPEDKRKQWETVTGRLTDFFELMEWLKVVNGMDYAMFSKHAAEAQMLNGRVNTIDESLQAGQFLHNKQLVTVEAPGGLGTVQVPMFASIFSRTPVTVRSAAPLLGQHTEEILKEIGCLEDRITKVMNQSIA